MYLEGLRTVYVPLCLKFEIEQSITEKTTKKVLLIIVGIVHLIVVLLKHIITIHMYCA